MWELVELLEELLLVLLLLLLPPQAVSNKLEPKKANKRVLCCSKRGILTIFIQPFS